MTAGPAVRCALELGAVSDDAWHKHDQNGGRQTQEDLRAGEGLADLRGGRLLRRALRLGVALSRGDDATSTPRD